MLLAGEAACRGRFIPVTGKHAGICIACDRFNSDGRLHIQPQAHAAESGEWVCPNKRYGGHAQSVDPDFAPAHPAD